MSNNTTEVKYVPKSSAKARTTSFGEVIRLSFNAEELGKVVRENKNAKGYINFEVAPRKTVGEYGDTHSIKVDLWEPTPKTEAAPAPKAAAKPAAKKAAKPAPVATEEEATDDIPF